ncbi:MAG: hypothetical protein CFE21_06520 [Bacteroidetes bacterium B1(2017)]|nr:MAG: hypothetical protein CFE21_06520 [Bacteroidetes bacterium B1(2017)]
MRSSLLSILFIGLFQFNSFAQPCSGGSGSSLPTPSKCFEIVSILVDACDGSNEGQNEMVRLKIGATPLLISGFSVPAYGGSGFVNWGAGASNIWRGIATYNATTLGKINTINSSISASSHCGILIPLNPAQYVPANANLLIITSTSFNPSAQSFNNLMDTLYVIMQTSGNTAGHFANNTGGTPNTRMFILNHTLCSDTVEYDKTKLLMQDQTIGAEDGGTVNFAYNGTDTYVNYGCAVPITPITYDAGTVTGPFCSGSSINLNASVSGTNCYVWQAKDTSQGKFDDTTILTPKFTIKTGLPSSTITLYFKIRNTCSLAKDSVVFTSTTSTVILNAGNDTSLCKSKILKLQASTNSLGTITWSTSGSGSFNNSGIIQPNYTPGALETGITYLKLKQVTTCGTYTDSLKLTLLASPDPNFSFPIGAICEGSSPFNLSPNTAGGVFSGSNLSGNTFTPNSSGSFPIKYLISVSGCVDSSIQSIIVVAKPNPNFSIPANPLCIGDAPINLSPTTSGGVFSGSGISGNTFTPSLSGTIPVKYKITLAGCADSLTQTITVNPKPNATFAPSLTLVCEKSPAISLNPTINGGVFSGSSSILGTSFDPKSPGIYTIKYELNALGCIDSSKQTIVVEAKPNPQFTLTDTLFCSGDPSITLTPIENGGVFSGNFVTSNSFNPSNAGKHDIQYTIIKGTCRDSSIKTVRVIETPTASFDFNPTIGSANEVVQFTYTGTTVTNYRWDFGSPIIGTDNKKDPKFAFPNSGTYPVKLWVSNEGCLDSISKNMDIETADTLIVPNVFTPNSDSINDRFGVISLGLNDFQLYIFNRWGGLVFESNSFSESWDGNYNGNPCPIDVYFYIIEAKSRTGHQYHLKGTLTLLR